MGTKKRALQCMVCMFELSAELVCKCIEEENCCSCIYYFNIR